MDQDTYTYYLAHANYHEVLKGIFAQYILPNLLREEQDKKESENICSANALDIGCSDGAFTRFLGEFFGHVIGIDVSVPLEQKEAADLKENSKDMDNWQIKQVKFEDFNSEYKFSLIWCAHSLYYMQRNIKEVLAKMYDMLTPGGVLVIILRSDEYGGLLHKIKQQIPEARYFQSINVEKLLLEAGLTFEFIPLVSSFTHEVQETTREAFQKVLQLFFEGIKPKHKVQALLNDFVKEQQHVYHNTNVDKLLLLKKPK